MGTACGHEHHQHPPGVEAVGRALDVAEQRCLTDGDRMTGVNVPGVGARFFHNGTPVGEVAEPAFAQAFFGIWLDPKTSRPDFRKQLLGE